MLKANLWLIAMACGCAQAVQAMSNGSAVRSGIGAIWVGALSATISALTLILAAIAIDRVPPLKCYFFRGTPSSAAEPNR